MCGLLPFSLKHTPISLCPQYSTGYSWQPSYCRVQWSGVSLPFSWSAAFNTKLIAFPPCYIFFPWPSLCFPPVLQVAPSWSPLPVPPHLLDLLMLIYLRAQSLVLFSPFSTINIFGDLMALHIIYHCWCPNFSLYLQPSDTYLDVYLGDTLSSACSPGLPYAQPCLINLLYPQPSPSHLMPTPSFSCLVLPYLWLPPWLETIISHLDY